MARHKDANWKLDDGELEPHQAQLAVLMDIRDELKQLNRLLHGPNFLGMAGTVRIIERRLKTKLPLRRRRK